MSQIKNVLITGATRGIGKAVAIALAEKGVNLAIHYNSSKEDALALQQELAKFPIKSVIIQADLSQDAAATEALFTKAVDELGNINGLVNNAGVGYLTNIDTVTEQDFDLHFNVNVKSVFFLCKKAIELMNPGGKIINYSGGLTKVMRSGVSTYIATKGAVEQLTKGLAFEAANKGITINAIAPGAIDTVMTRKAMSEKDIEEVCKQTAFGRLGKPQDIANFIRSMLSEDWNWCTGQIIHVNGGWV